MCNCGQASALYQNTVEGRGAPKAIEIQRGAGQISHTHRHPPVQPHFHVNLCRVQAGMFEDQA